MAEAVEIANFAPLPRTCRGTPMVLGCHAKKDNFLYVHGNSVVMRNLEDPNKAELYTEHSRQATVAKFAPSGNYIASGDAGGKVRVWDTINPEHILKGQYSLLGGAIKDICWSPDSQKIVVGGEGKDIYVKCVTYDSGNSVGKMNGHSKAVNSVAYKQTRPYMCVSGSEDFETKSYKGPPFKLEVTKRDHSNFVNTVRYSADGKFFVTGSGDRKAMLFDGVTAEMIGVLGGGTESHSGGIYGAEFSPNGEQVVTVSADKTAKIWDVASRELVKEIKLGTTLEDSQVGCIWPRDNCILSVSLSGYINYLDPSTGEISKVVKGHNTPIISMALTDDRSTLYTGAMDSQIYYWDPKTGVCDRMQGKGHSNQVQAMAVAGDHLITVGMDDKIIFTSTQNNTYGSSTALPSQPQGLAALPSGLAVVACINHIVVVDKGAVVSIKDVKYEPVCVDVHPGGVFVAVGASKAKKVIIYRLNEMEKKLEDTSEKDKTTLSTSLDTDEGPLCVKFSSDGKYLVVGGAKKSVALFDVPSFTSLYAVTEHRGRINTIAWSPDCQHFATGSLDQGIVVWTLKTEIFQQKLLRIDCAHKQSMPNALGWLSNNILVSCGQDSCIKQYEIRFENNAQQLKK